VSVGEAGEGESGAAGCLVGDNRFLFGCRGVSLQNLVARPETRPSN
jgi:hypothetical protein